jgi:hypothetical protein
MPATPTTAMYVSDSLYVIKKHFFSRFSGSETLFSVMRDPLSNYPH